MQDWDAMMAQIERQGERLARMRESFGWTEPPAARAAASPAVDSRDTGSEESTVSFAPSGMAVPLPAEEESASAHALPFELDGGAWDASKLILEEKADALDEEDVQCYLIRRRFSRLEADDALERMEQAKTPPVPAWDEKAEGSQELLYLQLEKRLADGRITEQAQTDMLRLMESGNQREPEMNAFYQVFTLLQNEPSQKRLLEVLARVAALPETGRNFAVRSLGAAASAYAREQQAKNAQQNKRYRDRQAELDRQQNQAQKDFDTAQKSADYWRRRQ